MARSKSVRRFLKNKLAIAGLAFIFFASIISILGYLIIPDSTRNANDQILEITNLAPNTKALVLQIRENRTTSPSSFFKTWMEGKDNPYEIIPITRYRFIGDSLHFVTLRNAQWGTVTSIHVADVVFPLSVNGLSYKEDILSIDIIGGLHIEAHREKIIPNLIKKIEDEQIYFRKFWLGTDTYGRDILSRIVLGSRISLSVGVVAVLVSIFVGVLFGSLAGYYRGRVDTVIMWLINTFWPIPTILLVFALTVALGRSFWQIYFAVGLSLWTEVARQVRAQYLSAREMQYVEAAKSLGFNDFRILYRHILPNIAGPLMVIAADNFATAILIESGLSFLGIGVQPPVPSWGSMLKESYVYIISDSPFRAIIPGLAIMLLVLAFNMLGNGIRDALDVKTSLQ